MKQIEPIHSAKLAVLPGPFSAAVGTTTDVRQHRGRYGISKGHAEF